MARQFAEDIVTFIDPAVGTPVLPIGLSGLGPRDWRRAITWLDHSGLALYFLQKVYASRVTSCLPSDILAQLEERRSNNERRIQTLKQRFALINRHFDDAGVRYAVLKGFSLTPEYCAAPCYRTQSDLDYVVAKESIEAAQCVLRESGYVLKKAKGDELSFWIPAAEPDRPTQQYSPNGPWMVELHLSMWDQGLFGIPLRLPEWCTEDLRMDEWEGLRFPCLPRRLAFVAQILHAFKHVLDGWVRPSWLFEISYFLCQQSSDPTFWGEVDVLVRNEPLLADFVAFISCLAGILFEPPPSPTISAYRNHLPFAAELWLRNYGREWLFEKLPRYELSVFSPSKLALFLREQYTADSHAAPRTRSLLPWRRVKHLLERRGPGVTAGRAIVYKVHWLMVHVIYHLGATLRYAWELPKWRYQTRRHRASGVRSYAAPSEISE
jgi:hypothetical protein